MRLNLEAVEPSAVKDGYQYLVKDRDGSFYFGTAHLGYSPSLEPNDTGCGCCSYQITLSECRGIWELDDSYPDPDFKD